ncbi:hypothetical protein BEWA_015900 [Theileria equi strain WA]|uniref:Uncharacterized protein n=1 Tax=Theileria equi strain WA TaxID=1537102 RepID=L1LCM1_THEEQ|nr:hypothetical protein BEWA_015900 [Theileria equi strain WA]EKX73029.1 hypothetical protein BEWA_015900 [Theileria equi strain WA]|eukprot:XP_004832481.1 hypothetical protein BEWA_015900 [Theileria equi strain WA]
MVKELMAKVESLFLNLLYPYLQNKVILVIEGLRKRKALFVLAVVLGVVENLLLKLLLLNLILLLPLFLLALILSTSYPWYLYSFFLLLLVLLPIWLLKVILTLLILLLVKL